MADLRGTSLLCSGFQTLERGTIDVMEEVLITTDETGAISSFLRPGEREYAAAVNRARREGTLETLGEGTYLLPGMIDMHVHAPQYPQLGLALDVPLEVWLNKYTFPLEARYADAGFARKSYRVLVDDLTANGTTTVVYFTTIHEEATRILVDTCLEKGQRAIIGKVAMDDATQCPDYYRDETANESIEGTRRVIEYIRSHPDNAAGLVQPTISPRFIPSCTDASLGGLGELAREYGCYVHTHASEGDWEHNYVIERLGMTDTESLDHFGLLGRLSVLAHSVFLTPSDIETIVAREAAVAHCPISNTYFSGAVFPLRAALEKGVHVGIGTDIAGGPNASVFAEMRMAIMGSRMVESGTDARKAPEERGFGSTTRIDFRDAFYLATTGGGIALDLPIGNFSPGNHFDAVAVSTTAENGTIRLWDEVDGGEGILQKIVYTASRPNIARVWVAGRQIHGE